MSASACAWRLPYTVNPTSTPVAPAQRSSTIDSAVKTSVAPRSLARRPTNFLIILRHLCIVNSYEPLGVEICRTLVDEMVVGVMSPIPGSSGKSGDEE